MKKRFLLSMALGLAGVMAQAATHNIYVANLTDWGNDVALYSWGDAEVFGGWPGAAPSEQVTIADVKYDKFVIEGHDGETAHPIFNNNDNGQQVDLPMITLDQENYYFATNGIDVNQYDDPQSPNVSFEEVSTFVYVLDKTSGWDNLYVYGWADGQAEVFGGWPGAELKETEVINGETFKKTPFPGNGTVEYNLIFNSGNDDHKVEGLSALSGHNLYVELSDTEVKAIPNPVSKTYNIYIEDKTGWEALYIYAYVDGKPSIFGAWPGKEVTETEEVDGVTYKVVKDVEETDAAQIFILNNNSGDQVDVEGEFPITENIFITATASGASGVEAAIADQNAPVEYYNLQGIKVAQPENGLYICRKGTKVFKVVK